jgi:uncharacterized protein
MRFFVPIRFRASGQLDSTPPKEGYMKSHEHEVLENFLDQLIQVRGIKKVPQADAMIRGALERQPDAAYLLVQRSLILGQALEQAKARIAELEQSQQSSFLDSGTSDASAPASQRTAASERPPVAYSGPSSQLPSSLPTGAPISPEPSRGSGTGGFLGQAAATAAGVAGGAFLFEGLEHMLNHGASPLDHASQSLMPENVTINNYYADSERSNHDDDQSDRFADEDSADDDSASTDDDTDFV